MMNAGKSFTVIMNTASIPSSGNSRVSTLVMQSLPSLAAGLVTGVIAVTISTAFATLVFFVSYLAVSGRKGGQILLVGGAFTLGVFLAYMLVGLGFYQVLELAGDLIAKLGRWANTSSRSVTPMATAWRLPSNPVAMFNVAGRFLETTSGSRTTESSQCAIWGLS